MELESLFEEQMTIRNKDETSVELSRNNDVIYAIFKDKEGNVNEMASVPVELFERLCNMFDCVLHRIEERRGVK